MIVRTLKTKLKDVPVDCPVLILTGDEYVTAIAKVIPMAKYRNVFGIGDPIIKRDLMKDPEEYEKIEGSEFKALVIG